MRQHCRRLMLSSKAANGTDFNFNCSFNFQLPTRNSALVFRLVRRTVWDQRQMISVYCERVYLPCRPIYIHYIRYLIAYILLFFFLSIKMAAAINWRVRCLISHENGFKRRHWHALLPQLQLQPLVQVAASVVATFTRHRQIEPPMTSTSTPTWADITWRCPAADLDLFLNVVVVVVAVKVVVFVVLVAGVVVVPYMEKQRIIVPQIR